MSRKKPENYAVNFPALIALCDELGFEYKVMDDEPGKRYQVRVWGGTHVIDIWPSRMVFHRLLGETIKAREPYPRGELDFEFNKQQVKKLLETGEL